MGAHSDLGKASKPYNRTPQLSRRCQQSDLADGFSLRSQQFTQRSTTYMESVVSGQDLPNRSAVRCESCIDYKTISTMTAEQKAANTGQKTEPEKRAARGPEGRIVFSPSQANDDEAHG